MEQWFSGVIDNQHQKLAEHAGATVIVCHQHPMSLRFAPINRTIDIVKHSKVPVWVQCENDHIMVIERILKETKPAGIIFNGREEESFCKQFGLPFVKRITMRNGFDSKDLDRFTGAKFLIIDAFDPPTFGQFDKIPYLWEKLDGLDGLERVLLAGQIPFDAARNLAVGLGIAGFEWSSELENGPMSWGEEQANLLQKIISEELKEI